MAIAARALQLLRSTQQFEIPEFVIWAITIFALVWMSIPILLDLSTGDVTPGIGWLLALASGVGSIVGLLSTGAETAVSAGDKE